jgi:hypothetical protein
MVASGTRGREGKMRTKAISKGILAGLVFSLLSAGVSMGAPEGNVRMSRIERADTVASRNQTSRKTETFRSEKTDSWLCNYVSPFFCSNLFPTLSTPDPPPTTSSTPVRGRK